jgi:hypothetical protein
MRNGEFIGRAGSGLLVERGRQSSPTPVPLGRR